MEGGYETANIPLEKQYINQSHAMPCRDEHKPNMVSFPPNKFYDFDDFLIMDMFL